MKTIEAKSQTKPIEIEELDDIVYIRSNIKKYTELDPVFGTEFIIYRYEETQYTSEEWNRKNIEVLQFAICELSGVFNVDNSIKPFNLNIEKNMSAVEKILMKLIKKKLITLPEIAEPYRTKIEEYLKE